MACVNGGQRAPVRWSTTVRSERARRRTSRGPDFFFSACSSSPSNPRMTRSVPPLSCWCEHTCRTGPYQWSRLIAMRRDHARSGERSLLGQWLCGGGGAHWWGSAPYGTLPLWAPPPAPQGVGGGASATVGARRLGRARRPPLRRPLPVGGHAGAGQGSHGDCSCGWSVPRLTSFIPAPCDGSRAMRLWLGARPLPRSTMTVTAHGREMPPTSEYSRPPPATRGYGISAPLKEGPSVPPPRLWL